MERAKTRVRNRIDSPGTTKSTGGGSPVLSAEAGGCRYEVTETGEGLALKMAGRIDARSAPLLLRDLPPFLEHLAPSSVVLDLSQVTYLDDFGVLVLIELKRLMTRMGGRLDLTNVGDKPREMLGLLRVEDFEEARTSKSKRGEGVLVRLGGITLKIIRDGNYLISFLGSVCLSMIDAARHPRSVRWEDAILYMRKTGVDALPIVGLISFLLGLIMAFMSSVQLQQFGANIYVASLVSLAMVRELGPIMTAIIVAGRSGSAFAAEIGTMRVSEEVDALFTMGFDPTRFLVVPKMTAALAVVPFLTLFSDLFAIFGGLVVGVLILDLTLSAYIAQTLVVLSLRDIFWSFLKSAVFAMLITWVGCFRGFQVRGSAAAVGEATTSAVVSSIFLIVLFDSMFAILIQFLR
jgi:phospholipid/cholesterol/gamma-HCH transport system permease protein